MTTLNQDIEFLKDLLTRVQVASNRAGLEAILARLERQSGAAARRSAAAVASGRVGRPRTKKPENFPAMPVEGGS